MKTLKPIAENTDFYEILIVITNIKIKIFKESNSN